MGDVNYVGLTSYVGAKDLLKHVFRIESCLWGVRFEQLF